MLVKHRTYLYVGKSPWEKCHSNPSMGNRKLHEENGLFKALQYISGKAERWSLSNPVVFLFGVLDYAGLHGEHPSQRLVLFKGWCKGLEKSLIQLTLTGACNVNQKICPYWRSEMN